MKKSLFPSLLAILLIFPSVFAFSPPKDDSAELGRLRERLKSSPADIRAVKSLAKLLERHDGFSDAARLWELAIRLEPDEASHYAALARCRMKLERPDLAREVCTNALAYFDKNENLLRAAGSAEFKLGAYSNALSYFRRAISIALAKEKPWLLVQTGKCRRELRDLAGSRDDLIEAVRLKDDPWAYFEYGKTLEAMGYDADALWAYERSKAFAVREDAELKAVIDARLAGSHYRCGSDLRAQGKKEAARKHFESILADRDLSKTRWAEKAAFWVKRL